MSQKLNVRGLPNYAIAWQSMVYLSYSSMSIVGGTPDSYVYDDKVDPHPFFPPFSLSLFTGLYDTNTLFSFYDFFVQFLSFLFKLMD